MTRTEQALLSPSEQISVKREKPKDSIMAKKSALQKIESHEKLCRIMQKQTFEQIKEMQDRIKRLEYWIVGGMGSYPYNFINGHSKIMELNT